MSKKTRPEPMNVSKISKYAVYAIVIVMLTMWAILLLSDIVYG